MKIKGIIEDLKIIKKILMIIVKIYLGHSLELLHTVWGQFIFIVFILLCLGWPFCVLAVCVVLFIVEFPHCWWGWMGGLSRFPG